MVSLSLATLIIFAFLYQVDAAPTKEKRSLWELDTVISCYTGRSGFDFNGYGCWCGLGGSGKPVDDVDRCCMEHDNCYQTVEDDHCGLYFSSYQYTKQGCASGNGNIVCAGSLSDPSTECAFRLCECDRLLASCLRRNRDSYNTVFANFEKRFCDARLAQAVVSYHVDTSSNSSTAVVGGDERGAYQQVAQRP
ncbi:acidic phospholipase A2 BpirPLA2-I [Strongylocentrotus purpuratus]|uniref:Phospholipase A2 n=1 Tax=Strongylocentrotus purpuratus TaxID=7668 RepID=A0A7M7GIT2_STRPU|nr:acidic phospholipase A2 BpirPLA2-I [Strongylocentrotus purpuratus]|eukprot:XP_003729324.1 PREDICTED: acidic phospholipase A2 BpirPLA2-I [Strongylocentrotus purpuratus]